MDLDGMTLADGIDLFMGLALDIDQSRIDTQDSSHVPDHRLLVRADLRAFADHGDIKVAQSHATLSHHLHGMLEELSRIGIAPFRFRVGELLADVICSKCSKHGVRDRMQDGIAVGMSDRALLMLDQVACQYERTTVSIGRGGLKPMKVVSVADSDALAWRAHAATVQQHADGCHDHAPLGYPGSSVYRETGVMDPIMPGTVNP